jgi:hypothetical protein
MAKEKDPLLDALLMTATKGIDAVGVADLKNRIGEVPETLRDAADRLQTADDDDAPLPVLDLLQAALHNKLLRAEATVKGTPDDVPEGGHWATTMPAENLYLLVPETRPFAKKVKPEIQIETIESGVRLGTVTDLRLLPIYLKQLEEKKEDAPLADVIAREAIPAYGPPILPELWPTLGPDNRTFTAASKIDIQATLRRLTEKGGDKKNKGADKQSQVTKAVDKLLDDAAEGDAIGPESIPLLKLALKFAQEATYKRKVADMLASMGEPAKEALPDLVDAFERTGFTRDYNLIRPMVVLGKDSADVGAALLRALEDRDSTVRLLAAFNLGQMGEPAMNALELLEDLAGRDPDAKVRMQATRTANKLRQRLEPVGLLAEDADIATSETE